MTDADELRVTGSGERWQIEGRWRAADRQLCNDYLGYLADRRYSPASVRAYAFDLLHFARWLAGQDIGLDAVNTDALLRYLAANRAERRDGQHDNVISLASGRSSGFAPATINRRLAAVSGLFSFRSMRDPGAANPVPRGRPRGGPPSGSALGCSGTWPGRSRGRSCGSVSRGCCRGDWTGPRLRRCCRASAPTGTGRSPG